MQNVIHIIIITLVAVVAGISTSPATAVEPNPYKPEPVVLEAFEQRWGDAQRSARSAEDRASLAGQLIRAADATGLEPMQMLLWHKAYEIGRTSVRGYKHAADALDHIQRADSKQRLWSLERLADLIHTVYRANPGKLMAGVRYFEVQREIAEQQIELVEAQYDAGEITTGEALLWTRGAIASLSRGTTVLSQCVSRAERDARRSGNATTIHSLTEFAETYRPQVDSANELRRGYETTQKFYIQLSAAERSFQANPSAMSAERLALAYITQADKPELITEKVHAELDDTLKTVAVGSCMPVRKLAGDDASVIGKWYADAAGEARLLEAKRPLLVRARVYLDRAVQAGETDAQGELNKVNTLLTATGTDSGAQDELAYALATRLAFQFGDGMADLDPRRGHDADDPADTVVTVDEGTEGPNVAVDDSHGGAHDDSHDDQGHDAHDSHGSHDSHDTDTTADAGNSDEADDVYDSLEEHPATTVRHGRPMTTCATCGRQFFAGWGVKATKCDSCTSGRKNIFDIDE